MRAFALVVAFACAFFAPAFAQSPPQRVELPIHATTFARGAPRYSIPIALGGVQLDAMLDTGSYGLRVLSRALPANSYQPTAQHSAYGYGSGAQLEGFITDGPVTIGPLSGSVPFEFVQSIGCTERRPDCPMQHMDPAHYGIGGNGVPDAGYAAIIGVGLRQHQDAANNPLPLLGATSWIVELPREGQTQGKLILDPNADDLAGFALIQLQHSPNGEGWADNMLSACVSNDDTRASFCAPAMIDSGAPGVKLQSNRADPRLWRTGTHATLTLHANAGDVVMHFGVGGGLGTHVEARTQQGDQPERLLLGTLPYFGFDVFYDSVHGVIGLKARPA